MTEKDRGRTDQALIWLHRIHDPDFVDWEAHATWLDADVRNLEAFDSVSVMFEEAVVGLLPAEAMPAASDSPSNDNSPHPVNSDRQPWWIALVGAVAASFVAVLVVPGVPVLEKPLTIQTRPGEQRMVLLKDGTALALNGDTRVRIDGQQQRLAILDKGEAYFAVHHNTANPFTVEAGRAKFQDVGTAFDVVRDSGQTRLAVRQGEVLYNPEAGGVRLTAGQAIRIADDQATIEHAPTAQIGGWREGKLGYHAAPLSEVADDLSRNIGEPVTVEHGLADRRFTGVIIVSHDPAQMFRGIASVLGVSVSQEGKGWRIAKP